MLCPNEYGWDDGWGDALNCPCGCEDPEHPDQSYEAQKRRHRVSMGLDVWETENDALP